MSATFKDRKDIPRVRKSDKKDSYLSRMVRREKQQSKWESKDEQRA